MVSGERDEESQDDKKGQGNFFTDSANKELLENIHTALDIAGMVPGAGEFFDLTNAGIYALEGNYIDAGVSLTAMIPAFGTVIIGAKIVKGIKGASKGILNRGGRFADLDKIRDTGEVGHHIPQNVFNKSIGRSRADGPALGMTTKDHKLTRTFAGKGALLKKTGCRFRSKKPIVKGC